VFKKRIRVANIIEEGRLGGPQIRIAEVAKALKQRPESIDQRPENGGQKEDIIYETISEKRSNCEIETTIIIPEHESKAFRERLDKYAIPYIQLPLHHPGRGWKVMLSYSLWLPIEIFLIWRVLKKHGFDVVHVSGGSWQVKGVIAGRLAGCKVLWHLNDTGMPGLIRVLFRIIAGWGASGFITAGSRVQKYYIQDLGIGKSKPVFVIQAPVDCAVFDPEKVDADERLTGVAGLKIVSVGNVNPTKGFDIFMRLAAALNQKYDQLHFFIVGSHWESQAHHFELLQRLKSELRLENMTFYGPCFDVNRIHKAADIYVCTSHAEASPLSAWEAMAMEKAIVSTDVGDVSRFVIHGQNGYIVPPGNVEALAEYCGKLIENAEIRDTFGKKAREAAIKKLDVSIVAHNHMEAYRAITSI
jgi:glycosyltransferase involved in cell wall biosynthesis